MWFKQFIVLFFTMYSCNLVAQSRYNLTDARTEKIKFELINNLIIIPVKINGVELSFLLDTGVSKPILFNIVNLADSLKINQVETIYLQGLGGGEPIEALKSQDNLVRIGNTINLNQDLFVILDEGINFTPRLGVPVHGIIGYDIFKDFIVEINYSNKYIRFFYHDDYVYDDCKKCETFELSFYNSKPYFTSEVVIRENIIPVKLLIDTGGSDALWLFEDENLGIYIKDEPYFTDFLGLGLSGNVNGHRTKIKSLTLKSFELQEVNAAFPDSISISQARQFSERNGSISGEILKRFNMIIDYRGAKLVLKKNSMFKNPFHYNKSGLILQQEGIRIAKVKNIQNLFPSNYGRKTEASGQVEIFSSYHYAVRPAIVIAEVRPGSPAEKAGLLVGDVVISINGEDTTNKLLQELIANFYGREGRTITMNVDRNDLLMRFKFKLEDVFNQKSLQN